MAGRACSADDAIELTLQSTAGLPARGGTTSARRARTRSRRGERWLEAIRDTMASLGVDALIPIGGEDTLGVARRLHRQGTPVVGMPKTIDNDLGGTDLRSAFRLPCRP